MNAEERRGGILRVLRESKQAVTGSQLSDLFGVTRQVVVADVAILRAAGEGIIATPQGYLLASATTVVGVRQTIASRHTASPTDLREELYTIVDNGGSILDVTVEHPVYGEMTGNLRLSSRSDVDRFLTKLGESRAEPLLVLTGGLHLHAIEARDVETIGRITGALREKGFLVDESK